MRLLDVSVQLYCGYETGLSEYFGEESACYLGRVPRCAMVPQGGEEPAAADRAIDVEMQNSEKTICRTDFAADRFL